MIPGQAPAAPVHALEPLPGDATRSVIVLGDAHYGRAAGVSDARFSRAIADVNRFERAAFLLQTGDMDEDGGHAGYDAASTAILARAVAYAGITRLVIGNHDMNDNGITRTGDAAAAAYGLAAKNWIYDLPFVRLVGVSPDVYGTAAGTPGIGLSPATIAFLADAAATAAGDVWVLCHAPLEADWIAPPWSAEPTAGIFAVLAAHPNVTAWISGHTHTDSMLEPHVAAPVDVGGRLVANINAGALAYLNPQVDSTTDQWDPLRYVVVEPGPGKTVRVWQREINTSSWQPWPEGVSHRDVAYS